MASDTMSDRSSVRNPVRGTYIASTASDVRGPCPVVNSLANHGYISRDGRNIRSDDLLAAVTNELGLSTALGSIFARPIFLEQRDPKASSRPKRSFLGRMWYYIRNPWAIVLSKIGMRRPGQLDSQGYQCLNLDQLASPGLVEHDISLTRRDYAQGDNHSPQPDLINNLLASSTDNGENISIEDFAALRRRRIEQQRHDNSELRYDAEQHRNACAEIALVLNVFGDGQRLPCSYAKAIFQEERLPVEEGWRNKRGWFSSLGLVELFSTIGKVKTLVGLRI